jgi:hypothetical protein
MSFPFRSEQHADVRDDALLVEQARGHQVASMSLGDLAKGVADGDKGIWPAARHARVGCRKR